MLNHIKDKKIGFIGCGNLAQAIIGGLLESDTVRKDQIFVSNRSEKRLDRVKEKFQITGFSTNEQLVDHCNVIFIATKPQDLFEAIEPISPSFGVEHTVISLAAGIRLDSLKKTLPDVTNLVRLMTNTPIKVGKAVIGYCMAEDSKLTEDMLHELLNPLGYVVKAEDDEMLAAITVAAASGSGFIFELITYWMDWIQDYGFTEEQSYKIALETFLGSASLAKESNTKIYDLLDHVTSKKGVTQAGLDSMRELDIERALRISFEKALLRDKELGR